MQCLCEFLCDLNKKSWYIFFLREAVLLDFRCYDPYELFFCLFFPAAQFLLNIVIYKCDQMKCIKTICVGSSVLLNQFLNSYQWVHLLLLVSNGTVDVISQPLHLLFLIAQAALDQLQFLPQLIRVESVCFYIAVCILQLWTERYQVVMELLDLWVKKKKKFVYITIIIC